MSVMMSQITGISMVCSVCSGIDQRKHQSSTPLAFSVRWIHHWPVDSPHNGPVLWKMFPFDNIIMFGAWYSALWDRIRFSKKIPTPWKYSSYGIRNKTGIKHDVISTNILHYETIHNANILKSSWNIYNNTKPNNVKLYFQIVTTVKWLKYILFTN